MAQRDFDTQEIRGITGRIVRAVLTGSIAVCAFITGAGVYIKVNIANHELRISILERWHDKLDGFAPPKEITYYDKPKPIQLPFKK